MMDGDVKAGGAPEVRDFAAWLLEHDDGHTVAIASRALAEATQAAGDA